MDGENTKYIIYILYLVVLPALFFFMYRGYMLNREREAVKVRTSVAPKVIETLLHQIRTFVPGFANNNEISIEQVDEFLHYGLVERGASRYHIDNEKYECLFRPLEQSPGVRVNDKR